MSKKVDVYWTPMVGKLSRDSLQEKFQEILYFEPEPILKHLVSKRDKDVLYLKCPSFRDYMKNVYVVRSPIDLSFDVVKKEGQWPSVNTYQYDQDFFNKFVSRRFDQNLSIPMLSIEIASFVFYSHNSIIMEQMPASMSLNETDMLKKIQVIPGSFDISKWIRPVIFSFEVIELNQKIEIKRGDPLYYIRFNVPEDKSINFIRVDMNEDLIGVIDACTSVKNFVKGNTLQQNYALAAPLIERKKDKLFKNKCPFSKWFK